MKVNSNKFDNRSNKTKCKLHSSMIRLVLIALIAEYIPGNADSINGSGSVIPNEKDLTNFDMVAASYFSTESFLPIVCSFMGRTNLGRKSVS